MDRQRTSNFYTLVYLTTPVFATGVCSPQADFSSAWQMNSAVEELCETCLIATLDPEARATPRSAASGAARGEPLGSDGNALWTDRSSGGAPSLEPLGSDLNALWTDRSSGGAPSLPPLRGSACDAL